MSKRSNGAIADDDSQDEKRVKLDEVKASAPDLDAEWEEFQALIAEDTNGVAASFIAQAPEEKLDIEIAGDDVSDEEVVTNAWDEDEINVEKRLETQEARKKYLAELRARRNAKQHEPLEEQAQAPVSLVAHDNDTTSETNESDDDDGGEEEGWIH